MQSSFIKKISLLLTVFLIVSAIIIIFQQKLFAAKINVVAVAVANVLLFAVSVMGLALQTKNISSKNANAAIRGVMAATILKLFVLAVAAALYIFIENKNANFATIIISMFLYIVYTIIEIKTALKINQQQRASNRTSPT